MPVRWEIDKKKRLMTIVGEGDVTHAELLPLIAAVAEEQMLGYRKLVDVRRVITSMTSDEMYDIGVRSRAIQDPTKSGPLAIVLPTEGIAQAEALLGMIAAGERLMRIFRHLAPAEAWIRTQKSRRRIGA
jgi:hypothetical protein